MRKLEADNVPAAPVSAGGRVSGPDGAAQLLGMKPTTPASRIKAPKIATDGEDSS